MGRARNQRMQSLRFCYQGALSPRFGIESQWLAELAPQLEAIRDEMLGRDMAMLAGQQPIPPELEPLDAGFIHLPARLLEAYEADRQGSELGRLFRMATAMHAHVDRVVVLGIGGSYMGARALMDACCQPYWNELSRGARGSRPRMYFEGNNVDNDASQGLLQLLTGGQQRPVVDEHQRWALVVISKSGGTLETAIAFRQFLQALRESGPDRDQLARLVIPVTGADGKLAKLAAGLGCPDVFPVPDGVGGRFSVFSAVGLVPAALLGINCIHLLEGAAAMTDHFATAPAAENLVLQMVGVNHLLEKHRGTRVRVMSIWSKALETLGLWYDQLSAESLGKRGLGFTPLTMVNTRDLHSRHQHHQQGTPDKVFNNIIVENYRADPLPVGWQEDDSDQLNGLAERTLPEVMRAAVEGTNQALAEDDRPTTNLWLPRADELHMGQLMQLLMLATVVEGRLMGINPYGQPGVEAYKRNMQTLLGMRPPK